jgi:tetratricopeptide (TPR) repeat protein
MSTLGEYEKQVKTCMLEEKWAEAYKICNKILSYDPENTTFIKLRNKIEKEVKNQNQKAITTELNHLESFIREGNFEGYLRAIAPLQTYVTDFPEIGEKILRAKKLLDKQYQDKRDQAFLEVVQEIRTKKDGLDYELTMQKLDNLYKLDIHKKEIAELQRKLRRNYIRQQIRLNAGLINSQRFEDIIIFLLKLKNIEPKDPLVNQTIERIKNTYQRYKVENKQDFIFKTLEEVKTLYLTKKYDLCLELCERILEIDPTNGPAQKYHDRAHKKADQESESKICHDIADNYKKFRKSKQYQDRQFVKI